MTVLESSSTEHGNSREADDHIDEVRVCLWTAAKNWPIVHLPDDTWAWRDLTECYRQGKTPDLSIRVLWQSYQNSHPVVKQEELGKEIMNIALTKPSSTDGFDPANFGSNVEHAKH
jgi:hypothetical protein